MATNWRMVPTVWVRLKRCVRRVPSWSLQIQQQQFNLNRRNICKWESHASAVSLFVTQLTASECSLPGLTHPQWNSLLQFARGLLMPQLLNCCPQAPAPNLNSKKHHKAQYARTNYCNQSIVCFTGHLRKPSVLTRWVPEWKKTSQQKVAQIVKLPQNMPYSPPSPCWWYWYMDPVLLGILAAHGPVNWRRL